MFRPPSLLASRIAPTAVSFPTGQLRRLHPSRTCVVAFARIGYAIGRLQAINRTGTLTPLDSQFCRLPLPRSKLTRKTLSFGRSWTRIGSRTTELDAAF